MGGFIRFQTNNLAAAAAVWKVNFSPIRNENLLNESDEIKVAAWLPHTFWCTLAPTQTNYLVWNSINPPICNDNLYKCMDFSVDLNL